MKYEKLPPTIFKIDDRTYRVLQKTDDMEELDRDYAYLLSDFNPYVFPYRGVVDKFEYVHKPGLYSIEKNGKLYHFAIYPKTEDDRKRYSKKRIINLTPDVIFTKLKEDIDDIPDIIIGDGDIFNPLIHSEDDIALAGMKYSIGKKQIDFNAYGHRFINTGTKNNGKRVLTERHTLKMDMLARFCEVFDINAGLIFWDKEGCSNPMNKDGVKRVFTIFNDEEIDLTDPDIVFEQVQRK